MLHKQTKFITSHKLVIIALLAVLSTIFGLTFSPKIANAGAGSIPEFSVDSQLNVHIRVTCPGDTGMTWQVAVDNWDNVVYEEGSAGNDFRMDGSKISNGHHNAIARVRCPNESWGGTDSTKDFDWFGGNPTPVPPPPGYEVSISINVAPTTVPPGTEVGITVQAACSNTTARAIRVKADGVIFYELGSPVVTTRWSTNSVGTHVITAEAACNGDDSWKTSPNASVTITVQENAKPSGGSSAGGTAGNQVVPQNGNNGNPPPGNGATIPQARQSHTEGGFDMIAVAYAWGYGNAHNDNGRWDGWIMDGGGKAPFRLGKNDFHRLCREVYGNGYAATFGGGGAGDIRCVKGSGNNPPDGGSNPKPDDKPMVNADGKPLPKNDKGDYVYERAGGSNSPVGDWYAFVANEYGALFCRKTPEVPSNSRSNVLYTMQYGNYFRILEVKSDWIKLETSRGDCWVSSQYLTVSDNRKSPEQPKVVATKPPVQANNQTASETLAYGLDSAPSGPYVLTSNYVEKVKMYKHSNPMSDVIGLLVTGKYFPVIGEAPGGWYLINTSLGAGWVNRIELRSKDGQETQSVPDGFKEIDLDWYNQLHTLGVSRVSDLRKQLGLMDWAKDQGQDLVEDKVASWIANKLAPLVRAGKLAASKAAALVTTMKDAFMAEFFEGSRADKKDKLAFWQDYVSKLESYFNDPRYHQGNRILIPFSLDDPQGPQNSKWWAFFADFIPY